MSAPGDRDRFNITRRRFLQTSAAFGLVAGWGGLRLPAYAAAAMARGESEVLRVTEQGVDIVIARKPLYMGGREGEAVTMNGRVPGPLLRMREGETVAMRVTNRLEKESASIHWHGMLVPSEMDGVPGVSFPGIPPGETFTYRFRVRQNGTYWYHSHSGFHEQLGQYGPIIIEPAGADPVKFDREHVVVLSDWTFENPDRVLSKLKKQSDYYNFQQRTVSDFFRDAAKDGWSSTWRERAMWGRMRMSPTDILDITGYTYTYLVNGTAPEENWTALFRPGERVRLRFINSSAQTIFNVRIPGMAMTVVQADGQNVQPVTVDEFQITVAETYDVIVTPKEDRAYTIFAEAMDRSGYTRGTLAPRTGMSAPVPPLRERPMRSMVDMGMDMENMNMPGMSGGGKESAMPGMQHDMGGMSGKEQGSSARGTGSNMKGHDMGNMPGMDHGSMSGGANKGAMPGMDHGNMPGMDKDMKGQDAMGQMPGMKHDTGSMPGMDHGKSGMGDMGGMKHDMSGMPGMEKAGPVVGKHGPDTHGPGNTNVAMVERNRLGEPGTGLENVEHRVLVYNDLKSLEPNRDYGPPPTHEVEMHLTGNMENFMWSIDGKKFSEAPEPIQLKYGERVRVILVNDTMMEHPMHMHGMFKQIDNGAGKYMPRKHTINVRPAERLVYEFTADEPGNWAFHCHLLYHMEAGMFRFFNVPLPAKKA